MRKIIAVTILAFSIPMRGNETAARVLEEYRRIVFDPHEG